MVSAIKVSSMYNIRLYPSLFSMSSLRRSHYPSPGTPCSNDYQCYYEGINSAVHTSCSNGKYVRSSECFVYLLTCASLSLLLFGSCFPSRCAGISAGGSCSQTSECLPPLSCGPDNTCITPQNVVCISFPALFLTPPLSSLLSPLSLSSMYYVPTNQ